MQDQFMERPTKTQTRGMDKALSIFIIEDVPQDADAIERELRDAAISFHAKRLESRDELLRELSDRTPDIVLSDFTLPDFDAIQALRLLQQYAPEVPFILVTGTRSEEVAVECIKEGADDYILKSSLKRLPSSLINVLEKRAAKKAKVQAEAALRRSEEQFRLIAENSHDLISLVDLDWKFLYASPSFRTAMGYRPEELAGTSAMALVHREDQTALMEAWQHALAHREGRTAEVRARHRRGRWVILEAVSNWMFDETGQPQRCVIVSRDITQRKQNEAALREMPRLIRDAQEAERRRVARELHDSVNQILSSVKFRMEAVEEKLARLDEPTCHEARRAKLLLEKTIQEVRRISRNLRPSELDDLGLAPAVRSLCGEFAERTGVQMDVSFSLWPKKIGGEVELNLYRIVQEALTNIERHARARLVHIRLSRQGGRLTAWIRDNGRGFDLHAPGRAGRQNGMGLVDMKERAAFMGGSCSVCSGKSGTEIVITVPLPETTIRRSAACEKE